MNILKSAQEVPPRLGCENSRIFWHPCAGHESQHPFSFSFFLTFAVLTTANY